MAGLLHELVFHAPAEQDVHAASRHVRGDGDLALPARFGDDDRLPLVELRVEHVVGDAVLQGFLQALPVLGAVELKGLEGPVDPVPLEHVAGEVDLGEEAGEGLAVDLGDLRLVEPLRVVLQVALEILLQLHALAQSPHDEQALEHVGGQAGRDLFAHLDGAGAHEHGLLLRVEPQEFPRDAAELRLQGLVDEVRLVLADHRAVGRDADHVEAVDLAELVLFGLGRARHARELVVEAEKVLERDRRDRLALALDGDVLLRLQRLVQAVAVAAAEHHAPGVLVHDHDLALADDVVDVPVEERVRLDAGVHVVEQPGVRRDVLDLEQLLAKVHTLLGERRGVVLLIGGVVDFLLKLLDDLVDQLVHRHVFGGGTGDDVRGAGLVDEDRVHLVDDREVQLAHDEVLLVERHVVPQVVESELVVRAVGDIAAVGLAAAAGHEVQVAGVLVGGAGLVDIGAAELVGLLALPLDDPHAQAEEVEDGSVPDRVAAREVVVDCDEVRAPPSERVEDQRRNGDEGLSFTRPHLGDAPLVEDRAADELHIEVPHPESALADLANDAEGLRQERVEGLPVPSTVLQRSCARAQLLIGEAREGLLHRVDLLDDRLDGLHVFSAGVE